MKQNDKISIPLKFQLILKYTFLGSVTLVIKPTAVRNMSEERVIR
jgi:hypothetical protein